MRHLKDVEVEDLRRIINRINEPNSSFDNFEKNFKEYFLAESNTDTAYRVADFIFDHGIAMSEKDLIRCNNTELVDVVHYIKTKLV